jgi:hypothetical protein
METNANHNKIAFLISIEGTKIPPEPDSGLAHTGGFRDRPNLVLPVLLGYYAACDTR